MIQLPTPLTSWHSFSWCLLHETVRMYARSLYHPTEFTPNYHMLRNQLQHRVEEGCQKDTWRVSPVHSTFGNAVFFLTRISKDVFCLFCFSFPFFFFRFNDSKCPGELITHQWLAKSPTTAYSSMPCAWSLHCTFSKNKVHHLQPMQAECKTRECQNTGGNNDMKWPMLQSLDLSETTMLRPTHANGLASVTANWSVSINKGCYSPLTSLSWPGQHQFTARICVQCWCTPVSWPVRNQFLSQNSPRWQFTHELTSVQYQFTPVHWCFTMCWQSQCTDVYKPACMTAPSLNEHTPELIRMKRTHTW